MRMPRVALTAALALMMATGSAIAAETVTAVPEVPTSGEVAAAEKMDRAAARKIARAYLKEQGMKHLQVGSVRATDDGYLVELETYNGVRAGAMRVDSTGKVVSAS